METVAPAANLGLGGSAAKGCRVRVSSVARPKFDRPDDGPKLGAQGSALDDLQRLTAEPSFQGPDPTDSAVRFSAGKTRRSSNS